jgi:LysR family transcriptional regulator for bpeEF and oprC
VSTDVFRGVASFVAVVEELSFRRAAVRLGVTPAAVSKAVLTLETELEVKLLERTSRSVSVTPEGALFFAQCRVAVAAVAGARGEVTATRNAPQGEVVVSAPFILAPLVVDAVSQLRFRHPRLTVRLQVTDQIARLVSERVDVAVRIGDADPGLIAKLLRKTRWRTVASPAYLVRRGTPRTTADLATHDCLVFVAPNGRPRGWTFVDESVSVPAALLTDHGPTLQDAARAGMGIAQVLDFMVDDDLNSGRLVAVLEDQAADGPPLRALTLPGRQSANVKAVVADLGRAFAIPDR